MVHKMNSGSLRAPPVQSLSRRERDRTRRRLEFLRAAAQVFGEKGYHEASIAEIARAAEYGTGTLYLYFSSKEELYAALLEEKMRELTKVVKEHAGRAVEPWEALRDSVRAQLEFYDENRTFFQSFVRERLEMQARLPRENWDRVIRAYEQFLGYLADLIKRGQHRKQIREGNSRQLALALSGIVNQLTRDALRHPSGRPLAAQAEFVLDLFRHGAAVG